MFSTALAALAFSKDEEEDKTGSRTTSSICCWREAGVEWKAESREEEKEAVNDNDDVVAAADADRANDAIVRASVADSKRDRAGPVFIE